MKPKGLHITQKDGGNNYIILPNGQEIVVTFSKKHNLLSYNFPPTVKVFTETIYKKYKAEQADKLIKELELNY